MASGIPVLIRLVNSEEDGASLIEIFQGDVSFNLLFFDLSGTIRETCLLVLDIIAEAVVRPIRRFLF